MTRLSPEFYQWLTLPDQAMLKETLPTVVDYFYSQQFPFEIMFPKGRVKIRATSRLQDRFKQASIQGNLAALTVMLRDGYFHALLDEEMSAHIRGVEVVLLCEPYRLGRFSVPERLPSVRAILREPAIMHSQRRPTPGL
jgi:hypothetical protein